MSSLEGLSDVDLRQQLRHLGVTDIGPINTSTRGTYLRKLEKLQKSSLSPTKTRQTGDVEKHAASGADKASPRLSRPSRKSTRISRKPLKFGSEDANESEEERSESREKEDEVVIQPSPRKKTQRAPPAKLPPTSPIMDDSAFTDKVLSSARNKGSARSGAAVVPGQANLNQSFESVLSFKVSGSSRAEIFKSTNGDSSQKTRPNTSGVSLLRNWMQGPAAQKPEPPPPVYSKPSRATVADKWINKDSTAASSNVVESFRSKLSDENLWLQKFSLDTNLTNRRRTAEDASRSNKNATEYERSKVPICGRKTSNFSLDPTDALKTYGRSLTVGCSALLNQIKANLWKEDFSKASALNRAPFKSRPTVDLHKFRQMNSRPAAGSTASRVEGTGGFRHVHRISWFHFGQESSRHIVIAFLLFLSLLTGAYFCTVYRERVKRGAEFVYGAGVDTVDFVYRNMILPVLFVLLFIGTIYGIFAYKRYKWHKVAEEQRKIFEMVEEIIAILKKHHEDCLADGDRQPYLAVPHVRDMLIPPQRRTELYPIWDKAVEYLNENESRIRTENQCVSGEEFMVWRWLQAAHAAGGTRKEKLWQGHAFPEEEIQNNAPLCSYFECLKLRGLFDPEIETGEDWPEHVQDAILEKLGPQIRVIHLALDMQSKDGCVYMKLATKAEAGEAFKVLNGSWFNGRLVSVKYLRPERYHQRFPDAQGTFIPLTVKIARNSLKASSLY